MWFGRPSFLSHKQDRNDWWSLARWTRPWWEVCRLPWCLQPIIPVAKMGLSVYQLPHNRNRCLHRGYRRWCWCWRSGPNSNLHIRWLATSELLVSASSPSWKLFSDRVCCRNVDRVLPPLNARTVFLVQHTSCSAINVSEQIKMLARKLRNLQFHVPNESPYQFRCVSCRMCFFFFLMTSKTCTNTYLAGEPSW